jgi:RPA family protein
MAEQQKRQVAYKTEIQELIHGEYVRQEGWLPNYILTKHGVKVSRVNLLATVISIQDTNQGLVVDDGTGSLSVRSFEPNNLFEGITVGDVVNVIGRPREFGDEKFVVPEIVKQVVEPKWVEVRKKEMELWKLKQKKSVDANLVAPDTPPSPTTETEETNKTPAHKIYSLIRSLDKGEGVDIELLIEKSKSPDAELVVEQLLREGDIFEIKSGRLKVLE